MSINLISRGSHGSNIALFQQSTKDGTKYIKESYHETSNQVIEREYNGYEWYFKNIIDQDISIKIKRDKFHQLILPQFPGIKFPLERSFHKHKDIILKIIKFHQNHGT